MLYSKLFGKTNKNTKEFDSLNATLLQKGGFIHQEMAGVYTFLPLGLRVLNKIESIIREEMDKISSELLMPAIVPKSFWERTGRIDTVDVLMKTSGANELSKTKNTSEYILNCTHEDVVTPLAQEFNLSYKDFPFAVYQIQSKFRNEARAKSGLLRGREFRMKDLYSFHKSEEELLEYYEIAKQTYITVFNRLGIGGQTVVAVASGGDFTKNYSHEFQTRCEAGEDLIFLVKSTGEAFNREVAPSKAPKLHNKNEEMREIEEIEGVGIIGVDELAKFLDIEKHQTTKTIIYETEKSEVIAAVVRGDYEINEEKLAKVVNCEKLALASEETVKKVTKAEIGYAGPINLPKEVKLYFDESTAERKNFECGANRTNYHTRNANWGRDIQIPEKFYDFKLAKEGDIYPETNEEYEIFKACEVGNIFPLNTKFSKACDYYYTDENGDKQIVYMGSYGIGPSRVMGVIAELFNDEKGIIWPENIAPYKVHLIGLDLQDKQIKDKAFYIYQTLINQGIEVLFDDREETRPGEKFADADLIGIPYRVVISKRTENKLEVKNRNQTESRLLTIEELINLV